MSNWAVFVTAYNIRPKALTRALLHLHDFEFGEYPPDYGFVLLTSKTLPTAQTTPTPLPLPAELDLTSARSDFAGMSIAEINDYVRAHEDALGGAGLSAGEWIIIDQRGLESLTCLAAERYYDPGEDGDDGGGMTTAGRAFRAPCEQAHAVMANLSIANMSWEDFVDEQAGEDDDGAWRWRSFFPVSEVKEYGLNVDEKRRQVGEKLREGGYMD